MNYDCVLRKLEELMVELMEKGIDIPARVIDDIKTGRSLLNVYNDAAEDPDRSVETYMQSAEAALLNLADSEAGKEYAEEWQNKINSSYVDEAKKPPLASHFISGVPKGDHCIRIKASEFMQETEISELLDRLHLSARQQEDGYLLVHGRKEDVTVFIKEVRNKIQKNNM